MSLTRAIKSDNYWTVESNDEGWAVATAFAMPAWKYRQVLSVAVRNTVRLNRFTLKWAPEIDPFALLIDCDCGAALICWNDEISVAVIMVPSDEADIIRESATQVACDFLTFVLSLVGDCPQPLSAFIRNHESQESWVSCEILGSMKPY